MFIRLYRASKLAAILAVSAEALRVKEEEMRGLQVTADTEFEDPNDATSLLQASNSYDFLYIRWWLCRLLGRNLYSCTDILGEYSTWEKDQSPHHRSPW